MNFLSALRGKSEKHVEHDEHGNSRLVRRSKDKEIDEPCASNSKGEGTDRHRASKSTSKGTDEHRASKSTKKRTDEHHASSSKGEGTSKSTSKGTDKHPASKSTGQRTDKHPASNSKGKGTDEYRASKSTSKETDEQGTDEEGTDEEGTDEHQSSKSKGKGIDEHYSKSDPLPPSGKTPAIRAHKNRPPHLHETKGRCRPRKKMYEEAKRYVSIDKGKPYPCTKEDLDACGGEDRQVSSIRVRDKDDLRALWFQKPNERPKVTIQKAALDIHNHNALGRSPSAEEDEAIDHLGAMIEKANQGSWGPEVVIKCFCDLDTVFFRGKLRDHVCVSWALNNREFPESQTFGNSEPLGHGKAWIILNAQVMFLDWRVFWYERTLNHSLAVLLHEMCHAYLYVECKEDGKDGYKAADDTKDEEGKKDKGHVKGFGTMIRAVNDRAKDLLGVIGDSTEFPFYDYDKGEGLPKPQSS